jgi:hypothetical protein
LEPSETPTVSAIQAESKSSQIQQNPAKPGQKRSKKKAWISLDFLVRIGPFQRVMLTPLGKKIFCLSSARVDARGGFAS